MGPLPNGRNLWLINGGWSSKQGNGYISHLLGHPHSKGAKRDTWCLVPSSKVCVNCFSDIWCDKVQYQERVPKTHQNMSRHAHTHIQWGNHFQGMATPLNEIQCSFFLVQNWKGQLRKSSLDHGKKKMHKTYSQTNQICHFDNDSSKVSEPHSDKQEASKKEAWPLNFLKAEPNKTYKYILQVSLYSKKTTEMYQCIDVSHNKIWLLAERKKAL